MTSDIDRIYDLLREQTGTLAKIEQSQDDLKERLARVEVIQSGIRDILHGVNSHFGIQSVVVG